MPQNYDSNYSEDDFIGGFADQPAEVAAAHEVSRQPAATFEQDLTEFVEIGRKLLSQEAILDEPPVGTVFKTNMRKNSFNSTYIDNKVLGALGLRTYMSDDTSDFYGRPLPNYLATYIDPRQSSLYNSLLIKTIVESTNPKSLKNYLFNVLNGDVYDFTLDPEHPHGKEIRGQILPVLEDEERTEDLVTRGFMTSLLLRSVDYELCPMDFAVGVPKQSSVQRYNDLSQQGFRPLGPEELYGMASGHYNLVLRHNPALAEAIRYTNQEIAANPL